MAGFADSACAQGKVDAQYEVTLAGIPVGKGSWVVEIADDQYSALASGKTTGLIAIMAQGEGNGGSQGRVVKGQLVPAFYSITMTTNKKNELLKIALANGNVKEFSIEPEPPINPDRIPVTDAHKRGVTDPMTGSLLRVPGTGDPVSPRGVQPRSVGVRRAHALRSQARVQADRDGQGRQGLSGAGCGLRDIIRADRRLCAGPRGDQISEGPAQHGSVVCADRSARAC